MRNGVQEFTIASLSSGLCPQETDTQQVSDGYVNTERKYQYPKRYHGPSRTTMRNGIICVVQVKKNSKA